MDVFEYAASFEIDYCEIMKLIRDSLHYWYCIIIRFDATEFNQWKCNTSFGIKACTGRNENELCAKTQCLELMSCRIAVIPGLNHGVYLILCCRNEYSSLLTWLRSLYAWICAKSLGITHQETSQWIWSECIWVSFIVRTLSIIGTLIAILSMELLFVCIVLVTYE